MKTIIAAAVLAALSTHAEASFCPHPFEASITAPRLFLWDSPGLAFRAEYLLAGTFTPDVHGEVSCADASSQSFNSVTDPDYHIKMSLGDGRVFTEMKTADFTWPGAPLTHPGYELLFAYADPGVYTLTVSGVATVEFDTIMIFGDNATPPLHRVSHIPFSASEQITIGAVPEPETYAMMVAGLTLLGWRRSRSAIART